MTDDELLEYARERTAEGSQLTWIDASRLVGIIDRQAQEINKSLDAFIEIREYWNRDENDGAMSDALYAIDEICNRALGE